MRKSIWRDLFIIIGVFALIWGVFTYVPIFPDSVDLTLSIENEEALADIIIDNVFSKMPEYKKLENPVVDSAIFEIKKRLLDSVGLTDYEYKITVVKNSDVNAVTFLGGNIFVFAGLIEFSESPEEVAAVLAHEIGHVEKKHVVNKLAKEFGLTILFSILAGGDAVLLSEIARTMISSVFDRKQEAEADDFALQLLEKSEISPTSLAAFFRRLKSEFGDMEELELIMTHPNHNSRIKKSLEYKTKDGFQESAFSCNWDRVKAALAN